MSQEQEILEQIVHGEVTEVGLIRHMGGIGLIVSEGKKVELNITEPQHLQEDLEALVKKGCLEKRFGSKGTAFYRVPRAGEQAVQFESSSDLTFIGSQPIGAGASAQVWKAHEASLNRMVAV